MADSPLLRDVGRVARRLVVLVRDRPLARGGDKFFYRELYPALLGRPYANACEADEYRSDQPFADLAEACEFWMAYLGLSDTGQRNARCNGDR